MIPHDPTQAAASGQKVGKAMGRDRLDVCGAGLPFSAGRNPGRSGVARAGGAGVRGGNNSAGGRVGGKDR